MHRIIVIGRGLIGSAAARHLTTLTDGVAVIGPDEPADRQTHTGVFASHYDEGRMTRVVDPYPAWSVTAKRSIDRYAGIEAASGIRFFTPAGFLGIGGADRSYLDRSEHSGREHGAAIERLDAAGIRARFPFLSVPDDADGLTETGTAGHLSPRAMVAAQTEAARRAGATIIRQEATVIRPVSNGVEVDTDDGVTHRAERVLIATGAFTDSCRLLPVRFDLTVFGRTVVLARIEDDVMARLEGMPTMTHAESGAYILPPIRYPDGHRYVKIGIGTTDDVRLDTREDFTRWFRSTGSAENFHEFKAFITGLIPPLAACDAWHTDTCAVSWTTTGIPYIDTIDRGGRVAVAIGGNGKGAKSSDDWGWIAAHVVSGTPWDHPVGVDELRVPTKARLED